MTTVRVRLPNGDVRRAEVTSRTRNGYRNVRLRITHEYIQESIRGRVTARHGFEDGRVLPLEVDMGSVMNSYFGEEALFLTDDGDSVFARVA